MLDVNVDRHSVTALHEQVAAALRRAIADGEALAGERLPPARDLAAVLEVNSNTVFRALRQLRDEGVVEFRRGRGVTVCGTLPPNEVLTRAQDLLQAARRHHVTLDEVVTILTRLA